MKKIGTFFLAFVPVIMTLLIFFGTQIVMLFLIMGLAYVTAGSSGVSDILMNLMNYNNMLSFGMYICGAIPAGIWYYLAFYRKGAPISANTRIRPSSFGLIVLLGYGLDKSVNLLMIFISALMPKAMDNYVDMIETADMGQISFFAIFTTIVLAPIVEEIVFRGLTLRLLRRSGLSFTIANIIQAVLFGLYHMNLVQGIYAFLIGMVFGYVANHYHTLLASMALHASFNFFGSIFVQVENKWFGNNVLQLVLTFAGILLTLVLLRMIHNQRPRVAVGVDYYNIPGLRATPYDTESEESFI